MSPASSNNWKAAKSILEKLEHRELISLVGELYRKNKENRVFIDARYTVGVNVSEIDEKSHQNIIIKICSIFCI